MESGSYRKIARLLRRLQMSTNPSSAVPLCTHIKSDGHRCGSPALRGSQFCFFHARVLTGAPPAVKRLAKAQLLSDDPIEAAIVQTLHLASTEAISDKRVPLMLRCLDLMVRNRSVINTRNRRSEERRDDHRGNAKRGNDVVIFPNG